MSKFIRTDAGLINLQMVTRILENVKVTPTKRNASTYRTRVEYRDGERNELTTYSDANVEEVLAEVIPATPGFFVVDVYRDEPYEAFLKTIIAWRISDIGAIPVCVDGINSGECHAVLEPNGKITVPFGEVYLSIDRFQQARATELREAEKKTAPPIPHRLTAKAGTHTYEALIDAGWNDATLIKHGFMEAPSLPPPPIPPVLTLK